MTYYNLKPPVVDYEWQKNAECKGVGSDQFYSPDGERAKKKATREQAAKEICKRCAVVVKCRSFAIDNGEDHGVWGGMTEAEREALQEKNKRRVS